MSMWEITFIVVAVILLPIMVRGISNALIRAFGPNDGD